MTPQPLSIPDLIDHRPINGRQLALLVLLGLTVLLDGADTQAIGYVAPAIIRDWGISRAALGPVFGAGLLGMLLGSLVLSVLADKIGRRPVIIGATLFFAIGTLATTQVATIDQLRALRFITGLGLGGIMPNAMALAGEYSPARHRVTLMMLVSCGFTGGAMLGGLAAAALIPAWGWRAVFVVGGIVPLIFAAWAIPALPESLQFLVLRKRGTDQVRRWIGKILPDAADHPGEFTVPERAAEGAPMVELFREGRAAVTTLLWIIAFLDLLVLYFLSNWLPTLAQDAGLTTSQAVLLGTTLQLGGVIGTVVMGPLIDRGGFYRVLAPSLFAAAVAIALFGAGVPHLVLFLVAVVAGFGAIGSTPGLNALAATIYPTSLRSTGIGWSLGIGRIGAIVGPVLAGALLAAGWTSQRIYVGVALVTGAAALFLLAMARVSRTR